MPNPAVLVCDSDALLQIFLTRRIKLLQHIKGEYGIQPVIVAEVEQEIWWNSRFGSRFESDLKKSIASGTVVLISEASLCGFCTTPAAVYAAIQSTGTDYARRIDSGEAYTFAAAIALNAPAMSHDHNALRVLAHHSLPLPSLVVRVFDLVALAFQTGALAEAECDEIRQKLASAKEWVPGAFQKSSFADGITRFDTRLLDATAPSLGCAARAGSPGYCTRLLLYNQGKESSWHHSASQ